MVHQWGACVRSDTTHGSHEGVKARPVLGTKAPNISGVVGLENRSCSDGANAPASALRLAAKAASSIPESGLESLPPMVTKTTCGA